MNRRQYESESKAVVPWPLGGFVSALVGVAQSCRLQVIIIFEKNSSRPEELGARRRAGPSQVHAEIRRNHRVLRISATNIYKLCDHIIIYLDVSD